MFKKNQFSNTNTGGAGFTLVEIIVVIGLIGVLVTATIVLINPPHQFRKAYDSQRKSDMKQLQTALEVYKADNNSYPSFSGVYGWAPANLLSLNTTTVYLQTIPSGPNLRGNICNGYLYNGTTANYTIYTILENTRDPDAISPKITPNVMPQASISNDGFVTLTVTTGSCAGYTYNYWANNP